MFLHTAQLFGFGEQLIVKVYSRAHGSLHSKPKQAHSWDQHAKDGRAGAWGQRAISLSVGLEQFWHRSGSVLMLHAACRDSFSELEWLVPVAEDATTIELNNTNARGAEPGP